MHAVYRHHLISVGIDIPFNEVVKNFHALQMFCGQNELRNILFHLKKKLKKQFHMLGELGRFGNTALYSFGRGKRKMSLS